MFKYNRPKKRPKEDLTWPDMPKTPEKSEVKQEVKPEEKTDGKQQSQVLDSTSALVESILPLILPIVRKVVSKQLISDGSVLYKEKPVTSLDEKNLPIGQIELTIEDVLVMNRKAIREDMKLHPYFQWPEKKKMEKLMENVPGKGREMLVLDFTGFDLLIPIGPGYEFSFPAELPMGFKGNLEVGSGGKIKNPSIRVLVPRLRFWYVNTTKKCYVAFMRRPQLIPHLHVNADRGRGDFLNISLTENGSLDDLVESLLSGFGPRMNDDDESAATKVKPSRIGAAVGKKIAQIVQRSLGVNSGKRAPLEVDLSETLESAISIAMGEPRSVEVVQANIELLEKELELAMEKEKKLNSTNSFRSIISEDAPPLIKDKKSPTTDDKGTDATPPKGNFIYESIDSCMVCGWD